MIKFYGYKACGTSRKAEKALADQGIAYDFVDITQNPPSLDELKRALELSATPIPKAFNTSGLVYKEGDYKTKLKAATEAEMLSWLAGNGRLIKRPLLLGENSASIGFKDDVFGKTWFGQ